MEKIQLEIKKEKFLRGVGLFILGVILPRYFQHETLGIFSSLEKALELWDKEYLFLAAAKLVFLNTVRSLPIYVAMLILVDSFKIISRNREQKLIKILIIGTIIPVTYLLTQYFYNINIPIGRTAIIGTLWFICYVRVDLNKLKMGYKTLIFLLFIVGIHWLDISPIFNLSKRGVGEISYDINQTVHFMEATGFFSVITMSFCIFFTSISVLLLYFFKWSEEVKHRNESEIENRYLKEVQQLVHDLKTPVFSMDALLEILIMEESDSNKLKYLEKIEGSLEKLNIMISEILDNNFKRRFTIDDMMKFVFSILSTHQYAEKISYENYAKKSKIYGNKILLARVLINVITNSWEANSEVVKIIVKKYRKSIVLVIEDYGHGIGGEKLENLMREGYSTKKSTGKGLAFVKKVIEKYNGELYMIEKKVGIKNIIVIKGENKND